MSGLVSARVGEWVSEWVRGMDLSGLITLGEKPSGPSRIVPSLSWSRCSTMNATFLSAVIPSRLYSFPLCHGSLRWVGGPQCGHNKAPQARQSARGFSSTVLKTPRCGTAVTALVEASKA